MNKQAFKKGDKLKCHWASGYNFTDGGVYTATQDQQKGHFSSDPYITVIDDNGLEVCCYVGRFKLVQEALSK